MEGYICKACCEFIERNFYPTAVNEVRRKNCAICGNNVDWRLDIISDKEELDDIMAQLEAANARNS